MTAAAILPGSSCRELRALNMTLGAGAPPSRSPRPRTGHFELPAGDHRRQRSASGALLRHQRRVLVTCRACTKLHVAEAAGAVDSPLPTLKARSLRGETSWPGRGRDPATATVVRQGTHWINGLKSGLILGAAAGSLASNTGRRRRRPAVPATARFSGQNLPSSVFAVRAHRRALMGRSPRASFGRAPPRMRSCAADHDGTATRSSSVI